MDNFERVSEEFSTLIENYIQNENKLHFQLMEESWVKLLRKGKINFCDLSYLSAFDIKFLKFKLRQYEINYLQIMENNDEEATKILSNFIIMLSIGIDQLQINNFNQNR
jgi:hypothetical protein